MQVAPPLELSDGPAGRRLSLRVKPDRLYWGVVQCHGPAGTESDYTDNRYWVALGFISNDQTDGPTSPVMVTAYPSGDPRRQVVTATNFFENNDATHYVRPQTVVRVWAEYDRGSPAQLRWTMIVADEGINKSGPCSSSSSSAASSSSSSGGSSSSGSLSGSLSSGSSSSAGGSQSASSSSPLCPAGLTGTVSVITALCYGPDGTLYYQPTSLQFCSGDLVQTNTSSYLPVQNCGSSSSSGGGASGGSAGGSSSSGGSSASGSSSSSASSGTSGSSDSSSGNGSSSGGSSGGSGGSGGSGDGGSGGSGGSGSSGSSSSSSSSSSSGSSSSSSGSSSSSSSGCLDQSTATCNENCVDANLPASVTVDTSALVVCPAGCTTVPSSMTLDLIGQCADALTPLYLGQDGTGLIAAAIEWDPDNGCFLLAIEGSGGAPTDCQVLIWVGYGGGPAGTYTRLCGSDGGCDANAGVLTLNVT